MEWMEETIAAMSETIFLKRRLVPFFMERFSHLRYTKEMDRSGAVRDLGNGQGS